MIPSGYRSQTDPMFKTALGKLSSAKGKEIEDYINAVFK